MHTIDLNPSDIDRFQKRLARDSRTGCLIFVGARDIGGYGCFRLGSRKNKTWRLEKAHRINFILRGGVLTKERPHVLHNCPGGDNPACCEFTHLWAGNDLENRLDMARKGRGRKSITGLPLGVRPMHAKPGRRSSRYQAFLSFGGRQTSLGGFATVEEAAEAVQSERVRRLEESLRHVPMPSLPHSE